MAERKRNWLTHGNLKEIGEGIAASIGVKDRGTGLRRTEAKKSQIIYIIYIIKRYLVGSSGPRFPDSAPEDVGSDSRGKKGFLLSGQWGREGWC